ncbi:hypothetical protein ABEB36_006155 [Hypothenemus hampei]|uniref:Uncharacterized protein n=1 Tax=Hypothenemus hampei TaxID=57062 RepID=A0ABD1F0P4_HYPHA
MSCPTSSWSENTKPDLINFLKLANQNKTNKYCNIEEYNRLKKFFPLDEEIKKTLSTTEPIDYIDITNSDEENICSNVIVPPINEIKDCSTNETTSNFKELIMDYLRVEENIPETLFEEILKLSHETREELFQSLVKEISLEELGTFWNSFNIRRNIRECIIKNFINTLFLPMIKQKHTYVMGIIFKELSEYNKTDLKSTLIQEFTKEKDVKIIHILLQYVGELRCDFRSALLSEKRAFYLILKN